jgi:hypothetical protein
MDLRTLHRLFVAPTKKTIAARGYRAHIDAKVGRKENSREERKAIHHFARSQVGLVFECLAMFDQPVLSGDDMNTIQVGRPAVSRMHSQRRMFYKGQGYNFRTHDFPHAWAGIKLNRFMALNVPSSYDDEVLPASDIDIDSDADMDVCSDGEEGDSEYNSGVL